MQWHKTARIQRVGNGLFVAYWLFLLVQLWSMVDISPWLHPEFGTVFHHNLETMKLLVLLKKVAENLLELASH